MDANKTIDALTMETMQADANARRNATNKETEQEQANARLMYELDVLNGTIETLKNGKEKMRFHASKQDILTLTFAEYKQTIADLQKQTTENKRFQLLPLITPTMNIPNASEQLATLGRFVFRSFENWELNNAFAIVRALGRQACERETMTQDAQAYCWEYINANIDATMYDAKQYARQQLREYCEYKNVANNTALYDVDFNNARIMEHVTTPTNARLDACVRDVVDALTLTPTQSDLLLDALCGVSLRDIAERQQLSYGTIRRQYARIKRDILQALADNENASEQLANVGIDKSELLQKIAELSASYLNGHAKRDAERKTRRDAKQNANA